MVSTLTLIELEDGLDLGVLADDIGRDPKARSQWGSDGLVSVVKKRLDGCSDEERLPLYRILANLAIDNDNNRIDILSDGGVHVILDGIESKGQDKVVRAATAALYNLGQDFEGLAIELVRPGTNHFQRLIESGTLLALDGRQVEAEWIFSVLQSVLDRARDQDESFPELWTFATAKEAVGNLVQLTANTDADYHITVLSLIEHAASSSGASLLGQNEIMMSSLLSSYHRLEAAQAEDMTIYDQIFCSVSACDSNLDALWTHEAFVSQLHAWLVPGQQAHCQNIAALILGNLVRRDDLCRRLMEKDVLSKIKILSERNDTSAKVRHALLSLCGNLSVCKEVRPCFGSSGLLETILNYLGAQWDSVPPIQRLALGILRRCSDDVENAQTFAQDITSHLFTILDRSEDHVIKIEAVRSIVNLIKRRSSMTVESAPALYSAKSLRWLDWLIRTNIDGNATLLNEGLLAMILLLDQGRWGKEKDDWDERTLGILTTPNDGAPSSSSTRDSLQAALNNETRMGSVSGSEARLPPQVLSNIRLLLLKLDESVRHSAALATPDMDERTTMLRTPAATARLETTREN